MIVKIIALVKQNGNIYEKEDMLCTGTTKAKCIRISAASAVIFNVEHSFYKFVVIYPDIFQAMRVCNVSLCKGENLQFPERYLIIMEDGTVVHSFGKN